MIDSQDKEILNILQSNARTSNVEIARQVGLAPSAILERVRRLEERGVIKNYTAQLDARALGIGLTAYVFVRTEGRKWETAEELARLPEVQEVHHVAGEDCYLAKVRVADACALGTLLRERIGKIREVTSTRTTVVLQTVKEVSTLPLEETIEVSAEKRGSIRAPRKRSGRVKAR